jgi:hypothetical protein
LQDKEAVAILTRPGGLLAGIDIVAEFAAMEDLGSGEPPATKQPDPKEEKKAGKPDKKSGKPDKKSGKDNEGAPTDPPTDPPIVVPESSLAKSQKIGKTLIKESSEARSVGKQLEALGIYADLAKSLIATSTTMETMYNELQAYITAGVDRCESYTHIRLSSTVGEGTDLHRLTHTELDQQMSVKLKENETGYNEIANKIEACRTRYKDDEALAKASISAKSRLWKKKQEEAATAAAASEKEWASWEGASWDGAGWAE